MLSKAARSLSGEPTSPEIHGCASHRFSDRKICIWDVPPATANRRFAGNFFKFSIAIFYKAEARVAGYITRADCSAPVRGADPRRQERAHAQRLHVKFVRQGSSDPTTDPLRGE